MQFLGKRAEWWSFAGDDEDAAVARALAPLRAAGDDDPRARVREPDLLGAARTLVDLWRSIAKPTKTLESMIDAGQRWLEQPDADPAEDFRAACLLVLTKEMAPRDALLPAKIAASCARRSRRSAMGRRTPWSSSGCRA